MQRWGRALDLPSISGDDYASSFTGQLAVDGSGSSLDTLVLDATAQLEPSTAFAATFGPADVTARVANRTLTASYRGTAGGLRRGTPHRAARIWPAWSPRRSTCNGTITGLGEPFDLERRLGARQRPARSVHHRPARPRHGPAWKAACSGREADITMFEAKGPTLTATASGRVALGDRGQSNLTYKASLTRLADIGPLVGRMLEGRVLVDGTITGNRADLASKGTAASPA